MDYTRREFLKQSAKIGFVAGFASSIVSGCIGPSFQKIGTEKTLSSDDYAKLTRGWDPVYGPRVQAFSRYGGPGDYQGHLRGGATPGIDYDVPIGTPLVPPTLSCLRQIERDKNGALYVLLMDLFNPTYLSYFGHLGDVLVDDKYLIAGDVGKYLREGVRALGREEIVALSGNSGWGPREFGWMQPAHLHFSLYHFNREKKRLDNIDPDKYGLEGGRPVFWDGRTRLDTRVEQRVSNLEGTLDRFDRELDLWPKTPELEELKGTLLEQRQQLRNVKGRNILDSKYFVELRTLLKEVTVEEKRYLPGSEPYAMMLKILAYSTEPSQKVILTLPFIAPGLGQMYHRPVFGEGSFYTLGLVEHQSPERDKSFPGKGQGKF